MAQLGPAGSAEHHDQARTRVPSTSIVTCWMRAIESKKPEEVRLISDPFAELLCGSDAQKLVEEFPFKTSDQLQFWVDFMATRTRWFDDAITAAKPLQMVILGAGLDSRAWRMYALSGTEIFEVDFPEVLHSKLTLLSGNAPRANFHSVPANVCKDDWVASLRSSGFQPERPSVWLLEGLTGYLTQEELDNLFRKIGTESAVGSTILATFTSSGSGHETSMHKTTWESADHVEAFLGTYGWVAQTCPFRDIASEYGREKHIPTNWEYFFSTASRAPAASGGC